MNSEGFECYQYWHQNLNCSMWPGRCSTIWKHLKAGNDNLKNSIQNQIHQLEINCLCNFVFSLTNSNYKLTWVVLLKKSPNILVNLIKRKKLSTKEEIKHIYQVRLTNLVSRPFLLHFLHFNRERLWSEPENKRQLAFWLSNWVELTGVKWQSFHASNMHNSSNN